VNGEEWRAIPGFEGLYEVSDRGRVRSLPRVVQRRNGRPCTVRARILVPTRGRLQVTLSSRGRRISRCANRLVAEAFPEQPPG
jgi:hypothetical protein